MNKAFVFVLLAMIAICHSYQPPRDFLPPFIKEAIHKEVVLSDACFGANFDEGMVNLLKFFEEGKIGPFIIEADKIFTDIIRNCPAREISNIIYLIQSKAADKSLYDDLARKILATIQIMIEEYQSKDYSAAAIGSSLGKIIYEFTRDNKEMRFLSEASVGHFQFDLYEFVRGFTQGMMAVEGNSQCFKNLFSLKDLWNTKMQECYDGSKGGQNFFEAFIIMHYEMFAEIDDKCFDLCNFPGIANALAWENLQLISERVYNNQQLSYELFFRFFLDGFKKNNTFEMGKAVGGFAKFALDVTIA